MEHSKRKFIESLITTAQETIWKNELALAYTEKYGIEGSEKDVKIKACKHALVQDNEYIKFLQSQLDENSI